MGDFSTRQPSQAFANALGSVDNPSNFLLLNAAVNLAKGQIEAFKRHMSDARLRRLIDRSIAGDVNAVEEMLESLQEASQHDLPVSPSTLFLSHEPRLIPNIRPRECSPTQTTMTLSPDRTTLLKTYQA
jgi:hypothetical protein